MQFVVYVQGLSIGASMCSVPLEKGLLFENVKKCVQVFALGRSSAKRFLRGETDHLAQGRGRAILYSWRLGQCLHVCLCMCGSHVMCIYNSRKKMPSSWPFNSVRFGAQSLSSKSKP